MKTIVVISILLVSSFANAQERNPFELDSLKHDKDVRDFIQELKDESTIEFVYLSDFNFARNDTYVVWKENSDIKAELISNKKLKKRTKHKRIDLSPKDKQDLKVLFSDEFNNANLKMAYCPSELAHFYYLKIATPKKEQIINSKCLPTLKEDKLFSSLLALMER